MLPQTLSHCLSLQQMTAQDRYLHLLAHRLLRLLVGGAQQRLVRLRLPLVVMQPAKAAQAPAAAAPKLAHLAAKRLPMLLQLLPLLGVHQLPLLAAARRQARTLPPKLLPLPPPPPSLMAPLLSPPPT